MDLKAPESYRIRKQDVRLAKLCRLTFHPIERIRGMLCFMPFSPSRFNHLITQRRSSIPRTILEQPPAYQCQSFQSDLDACVVVFRKGPMLYLAFRPTRSLQNWWHNLRTQLVPWRRVQGEEEEEENSGALVHKGFLHLYLSLRKWTRKTVQMHREQKQSSKLRPIRWIVCTGMSLGGALAELCAVDLGSAHGKSIRLVTFGSPRVGNEKWHKKLQESVYSHIHYCNSDDPIPHIPCTPGYCRPSNCVNAQSSLWHSDHQPCMLRCSSHLFYLGVEFAVDSLTSTLRDITGK